MWSSEVAEGDGEENWEKTIHCGLWMMMVWRNDYRFTSLYRLNYIRISPFFTIMNPVTLFSPFSHGQNYNTIVLYFIYLRISQVGTCTKKFV